MWKFLLDPGVQALAFLIAVSALAYVAWDLFEDGGNPSPVSAAARRRRAQPSGSEPPRRRPQFESSLEMWTDGVGETRGRVRRGPCRNMRLEEMSRAECETQAAYAREHDPAAAVALETYIRHRFGREPRFEPKPGGLSRAEALAELGLGEGASVNDIHSAYRKLIKKHHPDHGGSHAKAARLNQAKDLLAG
jgi:DnaJ domain